MHPQLPGYPCDEGCGSLFDFPFHNRGLPLVLHTAIPIGGVGVAHVITKPIACPADSWETDVALSRYVDQQLEDPIPMTGSVTPAISARDMHTYWCDLETLALCVQGVPYALHIIDLDYFDRKQEELRIGDWAESRAR